DAAQAADADDAALAIASAALLLAEHAAQPQASADGDGVPPGASPWAARDGWRIGTAAPRRVVLDQAGGGRHVLHVAGSAGDYRMDIDGRLHEVQGARAGAEGDAAILAARLDGVGLRQRVVVDGHRVQVHDGQRRWIFTQVVAHAEGLARAAGSGDRVLAPMPGRVVVARVQAGDRVVQDQEVLVMEAMKMELALKAPRDGVVAELRVHEGDFVDADAVLVVLEP
ncbi:MAG TPA: biotin/lipoyl-containing protein, partial [Luteimonas sp.]|nr:biotin/lipoyl-containing protein [Luteimonas sp.]